MKAKPVSPSRKKTAAPAKKKVVTKAKKKTVSPAKRKAVATAKKKVAAPAKKRSSPAKKSKPATRDQVMAFVAAAIKDKPYAYFVLETEKTKDGAFMLCLAVQADAGYYKLDWGLQCGYTKAKAETVLMNEKLGLTEDDVNEIIISTMKGS